MPGLKIQLFQTLNVFTSDGQLLDLGSPTTQSLFAYLVLSRQQGIDRRRLAFLFWPRGTEGAARRNLRQYLHRIRRVLEPVDPDGRFLQAAGHTIQLLPPPDWFVDVTAFEAAITPPQPQLETAVSLYTGDLLEDIYDDWVIPERERLASLYREALTRLIDQHQQAAQFRAAIPYAMLYLAAEPLLERAHVRLMELYYALGDRGRVTQQYEQLTAVLHQELGAHPLPETLTLYQSMLSGDYTLPSTPPATENSPPIPPSPSFPTSAPPLPTPGVPLPGGLPPGPPSDSRLIGREAELNWLNQALTEATQAHGNFIFIQGESGVGKTRLIEEWLHHLPHPHHLLTGRSYEFESMIPYAPLAQALRTAAHAHAIPWDLFQPPPPWLSALLPLLPDLPAYFPGQELAPVAATHHIIESLGNLLLTLARQQLVVLYVDNLHWADVPTWNFLGYLAQRAAQMPLLIVGTTRSEDMSLERGRLLRQLQQQRLITVRTLPRLSQSETQELVQMLMADPLPQARPLLETRPRLDPVFLRRIYEETEGNPFFITETIRAVREAGGDWTTSVPTDASGQRPFFAIPLQVQVVIESRLDKLGDQSRAALGVAAAIGREFSFPLLQAVSQFDTATLLNALDEWLARGLVRETHDGYDFTHEKLSQVVYEQLSRARRQWIHYQIANHLADYQSDTNPAQLAHHYYLSSEPARALPYLAQAGQRALAVRSYAEAREFGLRAIGLLGRAPRLGPDARAERIDLNLQLAQAYAFTGALPRALQMLQETEHMAESLGDVTRLARIFRRSAQIFWLQGSPATADAYARRTLRHAEELNDSRLRFAALRMLGRVAVVLSQYDDAISYLLRYVDLAERERQPDLPAIYGYLGVAYARVGSWQRAIDAAQKGLDLAHREIAGAMHMVARMQMAFVYAELREWEQALAIAAPMRDFWREEGMTPYAFMLRSVIGRCQAQLFGDPAGPQEIQAALQWAQEVDYRVQTHVVQLYLAQAQVQIDRRDLALDTVQVARESAVQVGDHWAEAVALRTQAEISMRLPRPDWAQVEANLIHSMQLLRQIRARPDLARTYLMLRRLYDRAGQTAWAVDCHFRATSIFEELGMDEERREAQGQPARERIGAVVIPGLALRGPNQVE